MDQRNRVLSEIVKNMPKGLTKIQMARYVYLEVCRFFVYNTEYISGDNKKKEELFNQDIDIDEIVENNGICSTISRALMYLLEKCDIQCNGVYFLGRFEGHMEVAIKIDGKVYELDPVKDLMNVKMGYETVGFAPNMKAIYGDRFKGYSYISPDEIVEIDNAIGYTYGLSKSYIDEMELNGKDANNIKKRIYMDQTIEIITDELYDMETYKEYIKSMHPNEDVDTLSAQELDKYRIEFLMSYANVCTKNFPYIEKREFFEKIVSRAILCKDGNIKLFRGKDKSGEMMTILKYDGLVQDEDLFYLIRGGQDIVPLSKNQVQNLIKEGFTTFANGREQLIIQDDKNFQKATFDVGRKINQYMNAFSSQDEKDMKDRMIHSYLFLQKCNEAISNFKDLMSRCKTGKPCCNKAIRQLYTACMTDIFYYGYDKYISSKDIENDEVGLENFLNNLQNIKSVLEKESQPIIEIVQEYKQKLKAEVKSKGILLYHVSTIPPELLEDKELKPMSYRNQYNQDIGGTLCASTADIESNVYLMSKVNGKGVYRLPVEDNIYMLEGNNVRIIKSPSGQAKAISKQPGYIYYMSVDNFEPVVNLKYDMYRDEYVIEFNNDWISKEAMKIPDRVAENIKNKGDTKDCPEDIDASQVYAIERYTDVTSVLEYNQIIVNRGLKKEDMQYIINNCFGDSSIKGVVLENIKNGRLDYLNGEARINGIGIAGSRCNGPQIIYDGEQIMDGEPIKTPDEVRAQKQKLFNFVENAIKNGVTYGDYMQIASQTNLENVDVCSSCRQPQNPGE